MTHALILELRHKQNQSSEFVTRSNTNLAVQPQKMFSGLKFWVYVIKELYYIIM